MKEFEISQGKTAEFTGIAPEAVDMGTGFFNATGFCNYLTNVLAEASTANRSVILIRVKLTNYQKINAIWAEAESTGIITASAKLIADVLRGRAVAGRVQDDTFLMALETGDDGATTANSIKEEIRTRFENFNTVSSKEYSLNPTIVSLTVLPGSGITPDEALAKIAAMGREALDAGPQSRYTRMQEGENDPRMRGIVNKILDTNDIDYHFQPIVSAKTGEVLGYEALMRTPEKYGVSPLTLLKYATAENRLGDVERATLFNVMKKMTEMEDELGDRKVFINSIPGHLLPEEEFKLLTSKYRHLFDRVVIETTEETDLEEDTIRFLSTRTRDYGFQVAVDDFGTGYSNVTNLLKFLPNFVKIDRSLIEDLHMDPRKQHFVNTIIQFAHDNGFQALAEGVETSEELNAAIRMGVDLIQGYFTGRPGPEPVKTISAQLMSEISRANLDMVSNHSRQKVFLVKDETLLSLVDLSLKKYSILLLSGGDVTLVGNPEFLSAVSIRVKDHSTCRLTLRNVSIGDVDATPCIDLGMESSLVLNIEGDNVLTGNGIRVPESAALTLEGSGNLTIRPVFTNAYGIGNDYQSAFGKVASDMTGVLTVDISGENCVCIGGKSSDSEKAIDLRSGVFKSICAASNCVCIGAFRDRVPVYISNMDVSIDIRIDKGTMIGSMYGEQDTHISHTALCIFGSGNQVTGIGPTEHTGGQILVSDCGVDIAIRGWNLFAIGAPGGALSIDCRHCSMDIKVEGNNAAGIGTRDRECSIAMDNVALNMSVSSANGILFGCRPEALRDVMNLFQITRDGFPLEKQDWFS
ncbi:MAG: GGDEF domain-containing protein [Lachnospiraceae bacterium]|nr:GGDEF domain-containing protein [Lachnospiraceae bacterium]